MENYTSLIPDNLRAVLKDYKESFFFILKNKWLYFVPLFFVVCQAITDGSMYLYQKRLYPELFAFSPVPPTQQSLLEKLTTAIFSIHWSTILSSLSFLGILNLAGVCLIVLIFYKRIKNLYKLPSVKKVQKYSLLIFILGLILSGISYLFFKNIVIISLGFFLASIGLGILFLILFTSIEAMLISYIKSLLSKETPTLDLLANQSEKLLKPLILFNIIISFISLQFFLSAIVLPDMLNQLIFGEFGNFSSSIPQIIYNAIFPAIRWFNAIFTIIFISTPFILALDQSEKLFSAMRKSLSIIKQKFGYYFWLILSAIIFLAVLSVGIDLIKLSSFYSVQTRILYSATDSLVLGFFLMIFYLTLFRDILKYFQK